MPIEDAARLLGVSVAALRRDCNTGKAPGVKMPWGERYRWYVDPSLLECGLAYDDLASDWKQAQKAGIGYLKPLTPNTIKANHMGMQRYWEVVGEPKVIQRINANLFEQVLVSLTTEDNCGYARKKQTFDALISLSKYLIRKGYKSPEDIQAIKALKPRRGTPVKDRHLTTERAEALIQFNITRKHGRSIFDAQLNHMILCLLFYGALRREEAISLCLQDIDFISKTMTIFGKGRKYRKIPLLPEIEAALVYWTQKYRPESRHGNILLQKSGRPLAGYLVQNRLQRLSGSSKIRFSAHALRHSCPAFLQKYKGFTDSEIMAYLGHSDIRTTQIYLHPDLDVMIAKATQRSDAQKTQEPKMYGLLGV